MRLPNQESGDNGRYPRQPYSSSSGQAAQDAIGHHHQGSTGKVESKTGNRLSGSARIENGFSSSTEDEVSAVILMVEVIVTAGAYDLIQVFITDSHSS